MPKSVFETIGIGELTPTSMTLKLADSTTRLPLGVLKDVPVQVGKFLVPGDFVVMKMEVDKEVPIILGRPFLRTAGVMMDAREGTILVRVGGERLLFSIDHAMKCPDPAKTCFMIQEMPEIEESLEDQYQIALETYQAFLCDMQEAIGVEETMEVEEEGNATLNRACSTTCSIRADACSSRPEAQPAMESQSGDLFDPTSACSSRPEARPAMESQSGDLFDPTSTCPSRPEPPTVELKPLPASLRYEFLGPSQTYPVIVNSELDAGQTEKLLMELRAYRGAIGYSIEDLKGIDPSFCTHRILMEDDHKPTREAQRRLNPNLKEVVKKEILKLLDAGIIYAISDSKWVSPVHVVPKKGGTTVVKNDKGEMIQTRVATGWRMCIDYRKLNAATRKDHFPLPFVDQMLERLANHSYFCYLDGYSGFFQIPIHPNDQEKTTFTCPYGTYAYKRMPFGLCNAPATFQRAMMAIFSDFIEKEMEVFMDDFSVYGTSFDSCLANLSKVLQRCEEVNLVLNWEKCHFMVQKGVVLGHVVTSQGIEVDKAKIEVIEKLGVPKNVKDVRSFLGHAGFYRRFIKDFSKIAKPLSNLLVKDNDFIIDEDCLNAFHRLKQALVSAPILQPPDWSQPFELMCDASDFAIGAVLGQKKDKKSVAIYYASKVLDPAQANYTTTEKELLAIVFALDKFRPYLVGSKVIVYTDHAAIRYLLSKKDAKPRLIRWVLLLQEFDLEIRDKKGTENSVADHLSRLHWEEGQDAKLPIDDSFPHEKLMKIDACSDRTPPWSIRPAEQDQFWLDLAHEMLSIEHWSNRPDAGSSRPEPRMIRKLAQNQHPWYADLANYLASGALPPEMSWQEKKKLKTDAKYYFLDEPYLFKLGIDDIYRRCVPYDEVKAILASCHSSAYGGHA
ncbi:Retroelement pol polyprotein-like [Rhynchospora pubera]|uniref:RNA-directed DNA polymerase n=1 Tax=Rhynchospora pubera TaxID=906938 RepID=A0AAV8CS30_9POAL|nr:Retroelement pol polyprotein-like [Rhynchospora pubera]